MKSNDNIYQVILTLFFVALSTLDLHAQKPNIVLIFADDLGYMDVAYNGHPEFETPNIDALAKEGLVFPNAYASAGNCAPSRACLVSGKYSPAHGVYAVWGTTRGDKSKMKVVPVPNTNHLEGKFVTMAEALKSQGYSTGLFGKWHLGKTSETMPLAQGFDTYFDSRQGNPNKKRDEPEDPKGIFSLTNAACDFITENKQKPFFAFLSHHAIHSSLEARPSSFEHFKDKGLSDKQALYAACTFDLDASVALVRNHLRKLGLEENTLIIFTSDNGATNESPQEPLRGNKGSYYEGGIREPFIACMPGKITPGINTMPIINVDLYPTFVDLAGARPDTYLDGVSIKPVLFGKQASVEREGIFWHFPGYLDRPVIRGRDQDFRSRPVTLMRQGDWKILLHHEEWVLNKGKRKKEGVELYNLSEDIGERKDLSMTEKEIRDKLLKDLLKWMKDSGAKLPVKIDDEHQLNDDDFSYD